MAYPALLDELLDHRLLYEILDRHHFRDQLRQQILHLTVDDLEQHMEAIHYFCRSATLRIAACETHGILSLMQVSDRLTWIAEVAIEHAINVAWDQLTLKYGVPMARDTSTSNSHTPGFIVVAYGKMGGIEMSYGSDLDLLFLHNYLPQQTSDGTRSIDCNTFFTRLGQRIIHILSTSTYSGSAYEIDMRLRPSGNSGMLVSTLTAFEKYQRENAWTWEHQALVRSRVIAGDKNMGRQFNEVREKQLRQRRDSDSLRRKVKEMRSKMHHHLDKSGKNDKYSLKHAAGGIVDIEFMVQFAVLAWSCDYEQLTKCTDNIRLLESIHHCGLITRQESQQLIDAYRAHRTAGHAVQLKIPLAVTESSKHRSNVIRQWQCFFGDD